MAALVDDSPRSGDERFYTPRASARTGGYSSGDDKFGTPRAAAAAGGGGTARSSDDYYTPRDTWDGSSSSDAEREEFYSSRDYTTADGGTVPVVPMPFAGGGPGVDARDHPGVASHPSAHRASVAGSNSSSGGPSGGGMGGEPHSAAGGYAGSSGMAGAGLGGANGSSGGAGTSYGVPPAYPRSTSSNAATAASTMDAAYSASHAAAAMYTPPGAMIAAHHSYAVPKPGSFTVGTTQQGQAPAGYGHAYASAGYGDMQQPAQGTSTGPAAAGGGYSIAAPQAPAGGAALFQPTPVPVPASTTATAATAIATGDWHSDGKDGGGQAAYAVANGTGGAGGAAGAGTGAATGSSKSLGGSGKSLGGARGADYSAGADTTSSVGGITEKDIQDVWSLARHNRYKDVDALLQKGLPVNVRDAHGNTILAIACQNGLKRMAKVALRCGADINARNVRELGCVWGAGG